MALCRRAMAAHLLAAGAVMPAWAQTASLGSLRRADPIGFGDGSAELDSTAQARLQTLAAEFLARSNFSLLAIGYADPKEADPTQLSLARATACAAFLRLNGVAEGLVHARLGDAATRGAAGGPAAQTRVALIEWVFVPDWRQPRR